MSDFSDYLENALLNHVFRNTAYTPAVNIYMGLYTVAPTDAGGGTEVTGGGYARQAVAFSAASGGAITNSLDETFTASGANFGTIVAVGLFDAVSAGNLLAWKTITSVLINDGDTLEFVAGDIDVVLG